MRVSRFQQPQPASAMIATRDLPLQTTIFGAQLAALHLLAGDSGVDQHAPHMHHLTNPISTQGVGIDRGDGTSAAWDVAEEAIISRGVVGLLPARTGAARARVHAPDPWTDRQDDEETRRPANHHRLDDARQGPTSEHHGRAVTRPSSRLLDP
jgi:hypothetical protein